MKQRFSFVLLLPVLCLFAPSCATYYQRSLTFQKHLESGDLEQAERYLDRDKRSQRDHNRFLYLTNKGLVNQLQGEFEESNRLFNEADYKVEDRVIKYPYEALALISNPEVKPYRAEDFEVVMVNYYKALNYLQLGRLDEARVEARRINIRLQQLNDKYDERSNRYRDDAFAHIMMGMIFEANQEYNQAFVAYRNAVNLYIGDSTGYYFGTRIPEQLKQDVMRAAHLTGLQAEVRYYEKQFGINYTHREHPNGELLFFWHNGMGPVKSEWSINFAAVKGEGGVVTFVNEEYDLSFPFFLPDDDDRGSDLNDLRVLRVAFPKYAERKKVYTAGALHINGTTVPLEEAENINEIAFRTLQDRFLREMGTSLLRLALKKASEIKLRGESETLGTLATVVNAVTEKADTRNWQTLPYSIHYARVPLEAGSNTVELVSRTADGQEQRISFTFEGRPGRTIFFPYHSLASFPPVTN